MTNYYVSLLGNDADNGMDAAWRHIDYAADHVVAGDNIYVSPGDYGAEHVTITTSGTESNPIKITRYGTSGMITLKHDVGGVGNGIEANANYWIIEHFDILDYYFGAKISGNHNTLNSMVASGKTKFGFFLERNVGEHNALNNCVAHHIDLGFADPEGTGYSIMGSYNLLNSCNAYNCSHFGISLRNFSIGSIVDGGEYYNMVNDTAIAGGGTDCVIKNVYVHDTKDGIRQYQDCPNLTITNCTIRNTAVHSGIQIKGNGATVSNNTISNWQAKYAVWSESPNATFEGNDMQGALPEYRFHKRYSNSCDNTVIRNQKGNSFEIVTTGSTGLIPAIKIEYTDGRTFSINGQGNYTSYTTDSIDTFNIEVLDGVCPKPISFFTHNTNPCT